MTTKEKKWNSHKRSSRFRVPGAQSSAAKTDAKSRLKLPRLYPRVGATEAQQVALQSRGHWKSQSFTGSSVYIQTPSAWSALMSATLTTYKQIPSDLSHVTSRLMFGVASTEQADGKEVGEADHIFPPELSGAAEGTFLTDPRAQLLIAE